MGFASVPAESRHFLLMLGAVCAAACNGGSGGSADAAVDTAMEAAPLDAAADVELEAAVPCEPEHTVSPIVSVMDAKTGNAICDATLVNAPDDSFLPCFGNDGCTGSCQYTISELGSSETATFSVTITAPGYAPAVASGLTPTECGCDAGPCETPQQITVSLMALDGGSSSDAGKDATLDARMDAHLTDARAGDAQRDATAE